MTVSAFDLATCPAVSRADAAASRALARFVAGLPPAWAVDLPLLGKATLAPSAIAAAPADAIGLAARREGLTGRLLVPAALASRWVDVALCGADGFGPARVLGRAERGVLIALLSPLLDGAGWSLGLGAPPELPGPAIALALSGAPGSGTLWLQIASPPSGAAAISGAIAVDRLAGLRLAASLRVATTTLTAGELAGVAVDDAVVFDGVAGAAIQAEADWTVELGLGGFCATLLVTPDGRATVSNGWRSAIRMHDAKDGTMDADDAAQNPVEKTVDPTRALADAPIEVVAELGRITLRADEVIGLSPGVVLGLRLERTTAVTLRIGGQPWAEGELVNVDGELGVRVTRLARG